jgi:hypothetical protein
MDSLELLWRGQPGFRLREGCEVTRCTQRHLDPVDQPCPESGCSYVRRVLALVVPRPIVDVAEDLGTSRGRAIGLSQTIRSRCAFLTPSASHRARLQTEPM